LSQTSLATNNVSQKVDFSFKFTLQVTLSHIYF